MIEYDDNSLKEVIEIRQDENGNFYQFRYVDKIDEDEKLIVEDDL